MEGKKLPGLPDYRRCLVNLSNSILKRFGAETSAGTLPPADRFLEGKHRNTVVLLLDAMGTSILEKHLARDGFFRSHLVGSFDSVYPPTTVAATTSMLSGLYPNEHGWLGWDVYYPQIGKNVTVFKNTEQITEREGAVPTASGPDGGKKWAEDSLEKTRPAAEYNVGFRYTPYRNILDRIRDAGGQAYAAMPFLPPYPQSMEAILERVETLCGEPGEKFIYAYWNEPDATMHRTGTASGETHTMVKNLEKMVEETAARLSDTLLIIVADHGHMDSRNSCLLDYPEVLKCLVRLPSIEPRTLNLFIKDEYREVFPEIFRRFFGDAFVLLGREEVLSAGLFGPGKNHEGLEQMVGDYVALAVSDRSIFNTHLEAQEMPGGHAGLTEEEREIPLIVIDTEGNGSEGKEMRIETERLVIREFTADMAQDVCRNSQDEDNRRFVPDEVFETVEEAGETIAFLISRYGRTDGPLAYPVFRKQDGANIGYVQMVPIGGGNWEIGYHIAKEYTCCGYATEAVRAFLPVLAETVGAETVQGICLSANTASKRVLSRCGFVPEFEGEGSYQGEIRQIFRSVWRAPGPER